MSLINQLVEHFKINRVCYDATRGELADRGLSKAVHGVKFSRAKKVALAQTLERYVRGNSDLDEPRLVLLGPTASRQVNSILSVDAFWSNALAVQAADAETAMVLITDMGDLLYKQNQLRWGGSPLGGPDWFRPPGRPCW